MITLLPETEKQLMRFARDDNLPPEEVLKECIRIKESGELQRLKGEIQQIADRIYQYVDHNLFPAATTINDAGFYVDAFGTITVVTQYMSVYFGIPRDQLLGHTIHEISELINVDLYSHVLNRTPISGLSVKIPYLNARVRLYGCAHCDENDQLVAYQFLFQGDIKLPTQTTEFKQTTPPAKYIWGESPKMNELKELVLNAAKTDAPVLIIGESGTGKELLAQQICSNSSRANKPYVKINCAAIPENLLESELFGYERGAFTGAGSKTKKGLFESANHGTILLDEIGEMPISLQPKLLRVLQEHEFYRVGGTVPIKVNCRIIASTNRDLALLSAQGSFRQDLYYRLNIITLTIPPLRERQVDIALLLGLFLHRNNKKYQTSKYFSAEAIALLKSYSWPGNVRELENLAERVVCFTSGGIIDYQDVRRFLIPERPDETTSSGDTPSLSFKEQVNQFEKQIISSALKKHGSTYKAARALGISQSAFWNKVKKHGLTSTE